MFERYTEKARRVVFFARYEASQYGSPFIETEHLLLASLREGHSFATRLLPDSTWEQIRNEVEQASPIRKKVSTSVDLPLSNESKRVLAYAAEEAERVKHRHIGNEHLFLGLLRERDSLAARVLNKHGVDLEKARTLVRQLPNTEIPGASVFLHGSAWEASYIRNIVEDLRRYYWDKRDWRARDLLAERTTGKVMFYAGESFDAERFELRKGGWAVDHCAICRWELKESSDSAHSVAYTNGHEWLCSECHDKLIEGKDEERSQP